MHIELLNEFKQERINYIKNVLQFRGSNYELIDPSEYEDGISDEVRKLPRCFHIHQFGNVHIDYAIVVVNIKDDILSFDGVELGDLEVIEEFSVDDLSVETICLICDLILKLEK